MRGFSEWFDKILLEFNKTNLYDFYALEIGKNLSKYSSGEHLNGLFSKVSLSGVPSAIRYSIHLTDGMKVKQHISE
jgi:hypothetical protein